MLDDDFFAKLGQPLTDDQKQALAQNIYSQLEDRVGEKLGTSLNEQQYQEFETLISQGSEAELDQWLQNNAPGYEQLVDETLEQLKQEAKVDPIKF